MEFRPDSGAWKSGRNGVSMPTILGTGTHRPPKALCWWSMRIDILCLDENISNPDPRVSFFRPGRGGETERETTRHRRCNQAPAVPPDSGNPLRHAAALRVAMIYPPPPPPKAPL